MFKKELAIAQFFARFRLATQDGLRFASDGKSPPDPFRGIGRRRSFSKPSCRGILTTN